MGVPEFQYAQWGNNVGNAIAQGMQNRQQLQQRNALAAALPGALNGDQNALASVYAVNPEMGLKAQEYATTQQENRRKLTADEFNALDQRVTQALANTKDDNEAAALWPKLDAYASQALGGHPEALAMYRQQFTPEYNPVYRQMAMKPEAPYTLNEGDRRFGPGNQLIAEGAPKTQAPPAAVQEYEYARQHGYKGSLLDFQTAKASAGASSINNYGSPVAGVDAQGNPVFFQPSKNGGAPAMVPNVRPPAPKSDQPTADERTAAFLYDRVKRAQADIENVTKTNPDAGRPELAGSIAGAIGGDTARNFANSEPRQRIEAAQLDALDAALTLATGAAYTKEQLDGIKRSYFPQMGDTPAAAEDKRKRFSGLIKAAEAKAGRALPRNEIPSADAANQGDRPPLSSFNR